MLEILLGQSWYETPKELHPVVADYNDYSLSYDSTVKSIKIVSNSRFYFYSATSNISLQS